MIMMLLLECMLVFLINLNIFIVLTVITPQICEPENLNKYYHMFLKIHGVITIMSIPTVTGIIILAMLK